MRGEPSTQWKTQSILYLAIRTEESHLCVSILIFVSEKAVKQMREERTQMLQKIIDNDKQWEKAKEEVAQVVALHSITQTNLEEQEQLTFVGEQRSRVSDSICSCAIVFMEKMDILSVIIPQQEEMDMLRKDLSGQMTALEQLKVMKRFSII